MFTGLVDHTGTIEEVVNTAKGKRLAIRSKFSDIVVGESIAVDGVCLTALNPSEGLFLVEVSPETLSVTTLGQRSVGTLVNLERSLRVGDRLGGHFVTGHVDLMATVAKIDHQDEFWSVGFHCPATEYLVQKGSIAINGVSLTINSVTDDGFSIMLIPHTLALTNLAKMAVGDSVNLEYDMLAKLVVNSTQKIYSVAAALDRS
ncbi:MAG: riboflavin synthase [Verrucomicrobia bacterium]|nr:riboflavin synthase [Verrucomicrobiota bacterium]MBS0635988.1 riboflavin synthase [Verrucomicrobiota bacterium]